MSADLFAAFGDEQESTLSSKRPDLLRRDIDRANTGLQKLSFQTDSHASVQSPDQQRANDDEFDDFGDFETAGQEPLRSSMAAVTSQKAPTDLNWDAWTQEQDSTSIQSKTVGQPKTTNGTRSYTRDNNILFDTEDPDEALWDQAGDLEEGDDDFGDFEGTVVSRPIAPSQAGSPVKTSDRMTDLLGLDAESSTRASNRPPRQAEAKHITPKSSIRPAQTKAPSQKKSIKTTPRPSKQAEDTWDDFETTTPIATAPITTDTFPSDPQIAVPSTLLTRLTSLLSPPSKQTTRPTTIPPPSVLLPLFSHALTTLSTTFLAPLSALSADTKSTLLTNPNTASLLKSHHALTIVLAHIIAGRKQRWKRDKYLAQSMSIGPSGSRSGMKIAGLDRSEAGREDQVAGDVLAVWNKQVGRLRSVVGAFNAVVDQRLKIGHVPELAEMMPVRIAKGAEGAVVGLQACALCGLKREERVAKVDFDVEDSFGEWWIEGVNMHTSCAVFWEAWKDDLRGR